MAGTLELLRKLQQQQRLDEQAAKPAPRPRGPGDVWLAPKEQWDSAIEDARRKRDIAKALKGK
jgi:hypothetical protein